VFVRKFFDEVGFFLIVFKQAYLSSRTGVRGHYCEGVACGEGALLQGLCRAT